MKNILLLLLATSCIRFSETSTTIHRKFSTIGGVQFEEKELEIDEKAYKLVDKIELKIGNI